MTELFHVALVCPRGYAAGAGLRTTAELLCAALRRAGERAVLSENTFLHDATNVVVGAHLLEPDVAPTLPSGTIVYNTESLAADAPYAAALAPFLRRFEVWDYSPRHVAAIAALGNRRALLVAPGYLPELARVPRGVRQDVDVLFYGQLSPHRARVLTALERRRLKVAWLHEVYGAARDAWIARAKVVLNVHYRPGAPLELGRIVHLLSNGCAVACECDRPEEVDADLQPGLALGPAHALPDIAARLVADEPARRALGERGFACIVGRDFVASVRQALAQRRAGHAAAALPTAGA